MVDSLYTVAAFSCTILMLIILSRPAERFEEKDPVEKAFRFLVIWVASFSFFDGIWGIVACDMTNLKLFFALSTVLHLLAAASAYVWLNYVLTFLGDDVKHPKIYRTITLFLIIVQFAMIIVNIEHKFLFYINEDGVYEVTNKRYILFAIQNISYVVIMLRAAVKMIKSSDYAKSQYAMVSMFVAAPIVGWVLKFLFPLAPFCSLGYTFGCLIIFTLVVTKINAENTQLKSEQKIKDIINVLSSECNAIYYCNNDTHKYDIVYQKGFVREEVNKMLKMMPLYDDAFNAYVEMLVHPDDKEKMHAELSSFADRLRHRKSFKAEFRRSYDGKYLYTEMSGVKVGEAGDELHEFVVGFVENDSEYRASIDAQKQLEYTVNERTSELQRKNEALNRINEEVIELLGNITEARDITSGEHIRRVRGFTHILANHVMQLYPEYGLTKDSIDLMTSASALHDIGKIMIPDSILLKPGKLTPEEFAVIKTHTVKGCEILKNAPKDWSASYLKMSMDICRYHHEKWDGKGYPDGLKGDEIPISAQIVSIADCFDALTSKRPYKEPYDFDKAFSMILNDECGVFSDKLLDAFKASRGEFLRHVIDTNSDYTSNLAAGISTASLSWLNILLAEDDEIGRDIETEILESEGAAVVSAKNGEEAVELFKKSPIGHFDAILMDVLMPVCDGIRATVAIRELDRPDAKSVSIIALTSLESEEDINRCLEAKMDSFIVKPIAIQTLNKTLYDCMQSHSEALDIAVNKADNDINEAVKREFSLSGPVIDYDFLFYVNGNVNDVTVTYAVPMFEKVLKAIPNSYPSNRRLDKFFQIIIPEKYFGKFLEDTNRYSVVEYLRHHASYYVIVPVEIDGENFVYRMRFVPDHSNPGNYIIGLKNANAEDIENQRASEIIHKLSNAYMVVEYIDLVDDTFIQYQRRERTALSPSWTGKYSELSRHYVDNFVHPDDREMMTEFVKPEAIREKLKNHRSISVRYREIEGGETKYREIQAMSSDETGENRNIIVLLSDVDGIVREALNSAKVLDDTKRQLVQAEIRANTDVLTGLKNIAAYTDSVTEINNLMKIEDGMEFAIVMCDIDDLKIINDTFGHDAGDRYIINCRDILTDVFSGSTVYRIGGDEFAVILMGDDYCNRDKLISRFNDEISAAENKGDVKDGRAAMSFGMAVFDPSSDKSVSEIMKRADIALYEAKRKRKSGN